MKPDRLVALQAKHELKQTWVSRKRPSNSAINNWTNSNILGGV
jgi:hypothetical protein